LHHFSKRRAAVYEPLLIATFRAERAVSKHYLSVECTTVGKVTRDRPAAVSREQVNEFCRTHATLLEMNDMKLLVTGLVIAVAATSPAFAQGKGKKAHAQAQPAATESRAAAGAVRSAHPDWDVYRMSGGYAGTDPDPQVRSMLRFDNPNEP
jgi:hypothetical protein